MATQKTAPRTQDAPATPITAPAAAPTTLTPQDMEAAVAAFIRNALGSAAPDTSQFDAEIAELEGEVKTRIDSGKNGAVLNVLQRELEDAKARRSEFIATVDSNAGRRIELSLIAVRHWSNPANELPSPKIRNHSQRGEGDGTRTEPKYVAKVNGEDVSPSDNSSISTLAHNRLHKLGADVLRAEFAKQNNGLALADHLKAHGTQARTVKVTCPDDKTRTVEFTPLPKNA